MDAAARHAAGNDESIERRAAAWLPFTFVALSLAGWWVLHRYWFMASDDYLFVTQGGDAYGRFSPRDWWLGFVDDWAVRNGRFADAVLRLVLRPGTWFYPLFGPVMMTACGAAIYWAIRQAPAWKGPQAWLWGAALTLIPALMWLNPRMPGEAIFWTAGAINYALPVGMLIASVACYAHLARVRRVNWGLFFGYVLLVVLTDAMQEMTSLGLSAVAVLALIISWRRWSAQLLILTGLNLVAFAVHMAAPGIRNRAGVFSTMSELPLIERVGNAVAYSSANFFGVSQLLWLAIGAVFAVLAVRFWGTPRTTEAKASAAGALAVAGLAIAAGLYQSRVKGPPKGLATTQDGLIGYVWLLVAMLALAFLVVCAALYLLRGVLGVTPVLAFGAMAGSCGFIFGSGSHADRAHFTAYVMLGVVLLAMLVAIVDRKDLHGYAAACVAVGMLLPSLMWVDEARIDLGRNHSFVEAKVLAPLRAAADAPPGTVVVLPTELPAREMNYSNPFRLDRYEESLRTYFSVPDDVVLTQDPAA